MALTQVSSEGIKDAQVKTADILDANITTAKILDQNVTLAKLEHGDGTSDGKFLRSNNGADPTWVAVSTADGTKMPLAGGSFVGDVLFDNQSNAGKDIFWDESADYLNFKDNVHATFGDGSDLRIYHDGSHNIFLGVNGADFKIKDSSNNSAIFDTSAGVELFYDNSKKFETTSGGAICWGDFRATGAIDMEDNERIKLGTGDDLQIYHDSLNSYVQDSGTGNLRLLGTQVELWNDGVKVCNTFANGLQVSGISSTSTIDLVSDTGKLRLGASQDLQIFHNGTKNWIEGHNGDIGIALNSGNEYSAEFKTNGAVELFYDNSKKFETTSAGATVSGQLTVDGNLISYSANNNSLGLTGHRWNDLFIANDIDVLDGGKLLIGNSDDLSIFHNGTDSFIDSITGSLKIRSNAGNMAVFTPDGAVELYHNEVKKFETAASGVQVSGSEWISEGTIYLEKGGAKHHRIIVNDQGNDLAFQQSSDTGANTNFTSYLRIKNGGDVWLPVDSKKLLIGAGDDLQLYHSTNHSSYISHGNSSGDLIISSEREIALKHGSEQMVRCTNDGKVGLYYNGSEKLETLSDGVNVTGTLKVNGSALSAGDMVKLSSSSSASTVNNITHDSLSPSTYRAWYLTGYFLPLTDETQLNFYFRVGGSDCVADEYSIGQLWSYPNNDHLSNAANDQGRMQLCGSAGNSSREGWRINLWIYPHLSSDPSTVNACFWQATWRSDAHAFRSVAGAGDYDVNNIYPDGFKLAAHSGQIGEHNYTLYGIKR